VQLSNTILHGIPSIRKEVSAADPIIIAGDFLEHIVYLLANHQDGAEHQVHTQFDAVKGFVAGAEGSYAYEEAYFSLARFEEKARWYGCDQSLVTRRFTEQLSNLTGPSQGTGQLALQQALYTPIKGAIMVNQYEKTIAQKHSDIYYVGFDPGSFDNSKFSKDELKMIGEGIFDFVELEEPTPLSRERQELQAKTLTKVAKEFTKNFQPAPRALRDTSDGRRYNMQWLSLISEGQFLTRPSDHKITPKCGAIPVQHNLHVVATHNRDHKAKGNNDAKTIKKQARQEKVNKMRAQGTNVSTATKAIDTVLTSKMTAIDAEKNMANLVELDDYHTGLQTSYAILFAHALLAKKHLKKTCINNKLWIRGSDLALIVQKAYVQLKDNPKYKALRSKMDSTLRENVACGNSRAAHPKPHQHEAHQTTQRPQIQFGGGGGCGC
jgi:hypothetical protein